jgi:hypothetical protein
VVERVEGGVGIRPEPGIRLHHPVMRWAATFCAGAVFVVGCQSSDRTAPRCDDLAGTQSTGTELAGDVDGDGDADRVTLREDETRAPHCRHLLVVELASGTAVAAVEPLDWPGTDPALLLLAEIDGRPGLEPVLTLSPAAVYQPGAVFTVRGGGLARMRLEAGAPSRLYPELFPLDDEFPAGVDCAERPGRIVVTVGSLAEGGDRFWDVTRTLLRASGSGFEPIRRQRFRVEVGPEAQQRWPELAGDPFRSCPDRVRSRL